MFKVKRKIVSFQNERNRLIRKQVPPVFAAAAAGGHDGFRLLLLQSNILDMICFRAV